MKCEEINYRKCEATVGEYKISMDSKKESCLCIRDNSPAFASSIYTRNSLRLGKKVAKQVLLEALAIVEELE